MSNITKPLRQLELLLLPYGIKTVTTGSGEALEYLKARYGNDVDAAFRQELAQITDTPVVVLGVPNDNGAGFDRGSKKGPLAIRKQWLAEGGLPKGILDIGDVRDHPLLSHDELLHPSVIEAVRKERWGEEGRTLALPVSCLSILERALECIYALNPSCRVMMLGGDHSKSLIPVQLLARTHKNLGVLQFDAHTDLLEKRDGLAHSYATWSWHANEAIGRGERLVQVGVRTSGKSAEEWRNELQVRQVWADQVNNDTIETVVAHYKGLAVENLYLSTDIDAISPEFAAATGTAEPNGLHPDFIQALIQRISQEFTLLGADLMEVAPPLAGGVDGEPQRTIELASKLARLQALTLSL